VGIQSNTTMLRFLKWCLLHFKRHVSAHLQWPKHVAWSVINTIWETVASCVRLYTHINNYTGRISRKRPQTIVYKSSCVLGCEMRTFSWASQPQQSGTLGPQQWWETTKSTRDMWWHLRKKNNLTDWKQESYFPKITSFINTCKIARFTDAPCA
jgi:hypothetical protein